MAIDRSTVPSWMLPTTRRPAMDHPKPEHERAWKDRIILRDQNRCRWCERHADFVGSMDVHHVTYENFGFEEDKDGICLCRECHDIVTVEQRKRIRLAEKQERFLG